MAKYCSKGHSSEQIAKFCSKCGESFDEAYAKMFGQPVAQPTRATPAVAAAPVRRRKIVEIEVDDEGNEYEVEITQGGESFTLARATLADIIVQSSGPLTIGSIMKNPDAYSNLGQRQAEQKIELPND